MMTTFKLTAQHIRSAMQDAGFYPDHRRNDGEFWYDDAGHYMMLAYKGDKPGACAPDKLLFGIVEINIGDGSDDEPEIKVYRAPGYTHQF